MDPLLPIRSPSAPWRRVQSQPGSSRWVLQLLRCSSRPAAPQGFAMVLVILAALMLAAGGLALANRASSGLLGSVFQGFSLEAREAAEIGMNRIIAELNKPTNRGMLRSRGPTAETGLWNAADLALFYRNKCPGTSAPDMTSGSALAITLGYPQASTVPSAAYDPVYLLPDGTASTSSRGANRSYQLISTASNPTRRPSEADLHIFANGDDGQANLTLSVKGRALRPDGSTVSEVVLQKTFKLVPKCCGASFGGAHGNVSYASSGTGASLSNVCLDVGTMLGLGLLGGTGSSTGTFDLRGSNSITNGTVPITNVFCMADAAGNDCTTYATSNQGISITPLNPRPANFPLAKTYPGDINAILASDKQGGKVVLSKPKPTAKPTAFLGCLSSEAATSTDLLADPTVVNGKKCRVWQINADVTRSSLPSFCTITPLGGSSASAVAGEELHCAIESLDYKSTDVVVLSSTRQVRLYFTAPSISSSDTVITGGTGNNAIYHCNSIDKTQLPSVVCTGVAPSIRDFALFGCNGCGNQFVELKGTADALKMFAYFPNGNFTLAGNPNFEGVLWANKIESSGNVTWTVPSAGLLDVHDYMGFVPRDAFSLSPASKNWFLFDYVARAVYTFSWRSP